MRAAIIREVLPGPVKNEVALVRKLTLEDATPRASVPVKRMDFKGRDAAEAMFKESVEGERE